MQKLFCLIIALIVILLNTSGLYAYDIRIGLQTRVSSAFVGSEKDAVIIDASNNKPLVRISGKEKYKVYAESNIIYLIKNSNAKRLNTFSNAIYLLPVNDRSYVYAKNHWYRGCFKIIARGNYVTVVNILDLEDYLKSVIPSEMPASWHLEALKAQAISARSYALANRNKRNSEGYDLNDTPQDQAYKGAAKETFKSNQAVKLTNGEVLVSGKKIVPAYYHSSSGGVTDNQGWTGRINFVKSVRDYDQQSPKFNWSKTFTMQNISSILTIAGLGVGNITGILPIERTALGRIHKLKLVGSKGSKTVDVERLQKVLNLPSNLFSVFNSGGMLSIRGRGCGHGIGMSQWGAKAMAERGCNAYQILGYYYTNVRVRKISEKG